MGMGALTEGDGNWGEPVRAYFKARVIGGTGLITTQVVLVTRRLEPISQHMLDIRSAKHRESFRRIADDAHANGACLSVQLSAGFGRVVSVLNDPGVIPVSASENPCFFNRSRTTRALTTGEAADLAVSFGEAARLCREAGADAVELHGHEGYLLDQFMTSLWNRRTDRYGGCPENRLQLVREAISAIRKEAGHDLPVIYRYGINHHLPDGRRVEESLWIARQLEAMGFDALHIDAGCYETGWWPHPTTYQAPGFMTDLAAKVKAVVRIPVISVGKLHFPETAEAALADGKTDFICIGRGLLADPDWPEKLRAGRVKEIRPCIGDNHGCLGEMISRHPTSCTVNPFCGHEMEYAFQTITSRKSVLIIGGGPAGLEAARVASVRGFRVTLWEKEKRWGGNLIPAAVPDFKPDLRAYLNYLSSLAESGKFEYQIGYEASPGDIRAFGADHIILATGAVLVPPSVTGLEDRSYSAIDVQLGRALPGKRVLVVGGGMIGAETALFLAQRGFQVALTSRRGEIATDAYRVNRLLLLSMLAESRVTIVNGTALVRGISGGVRLITGEVESDLETDAVVFARDMRPLNTLHSIFSGQVPSLIPVGDCVEPGHLKDAVWSAFHAARKLT
jgi:2-enoate reductase